MARELTKHTVGKNVYLIGDWDVDKSLEVLVWLSKTFGEGFISIFMSEDGSEIADKAKEGEKINSEKEKALALEFAQTITKNLSAKEYVHYSKKIIEGAKCNGNDIDFGTHFIGKMKELHEVMFVTLKRQYGSFLGESIGEE